MVCGADSRSDACESLGREPVAVGGRTRDVDLASVLIARPGDVEPDAGELCTSHVSAPADLLLVNAMERTRRAD